MESYTCHSDVNVYLLSQLCTNGSSSSKYECFVFKNSTANRIRQVSAIWNIIIGSIGIFGNLATISTVPCAAKRKRHGLDSNFRTTTLFILHFSFIDLLHCLFMVLPRGISYLHESSPFGRYGCPIIIYGGNVTFVADMLALALIVVSRCLDMVMKENWKRFCNKQRNLIFLFLIVWVPSLLSISLLPILQTHGIEIGWNCELGGCGYVRASESLDDKNILAVGDNNLGNCSFDIEVWRYMHITTICVPIFALLIIICSYLVMLYKVHNSTMYFFDNKEISARFNRRDRKMTQTILIFVALNVLF